MAVLIAGAVFVFLVYVVGGTVYSHRKRKGGVK